ncbi:MAG: response regulator [Vicingaceae bacterium]
MKRTVLYIDDEEANLRTFRSAFRREYTIMTALNGKEALKILETENPDVLITDQRMPEMSGVELLKQLCELYPFSKISRVMLSGNAEAADINEAKEKYMLKCFLPKPCGHDVLKQIIDSV